MQTTGRKHISEDAFDALVQNVEKTISKATGRYPDTGEVEEALRDLLLGMDVFVREHWPLEDRGG